MRRATSLLVIAACGRAAPPSAWNPDTVARVNGAAITQADVDQVKQGSHEEAAPADPVGVVVDEELAAQRAVALGLDQDPAYQARLHQLEAPARAFARRELAARYYQSLAKAAQPSDDDVRAYYDAHQPQIATELDVWQIAGDPASLAADSAQLAAGASFEDVARAHFPGMPPGRAPWDVGWLHWNQLPDAWGATIHGLADGATSGVIAGPNGRSWIIHVVARRPAEHSSLADEADTIRGVLGAQEVASERSRAAADLREGADVELAR